MRSEIFNIRTPLQLGKSNLPGVLPKAHGSKARNRTVRVLRAEEMFHRHDDFWDRDGDFLEPEDEEE